MGELLIKQGKSLSWDYNGGNELCGMIITGDDYIKWFLFYPCNCSRFIHSHPCQYEQCSVNHYSG